ncbi:hypothetical protein O3M35_003181 [Rhynocoris fuscipes]|uniref:Lamin-B receptor n=1 Tax=Rhynocoris fuscipes TaxID=488301 RepID=A0AAW1CJ76_9HEMI
MNNRSVRQVRKSPVRFVAEGVRRERSRSRGRRYKSPVRTKKQDIPESPKEERVRPKSPARNAKSPAKSPSRRKVVEDKEVKKKSSPVKSVESRASRIEEFIRSSITPDHKIEEVIRRSVSRFEEALEEVAPGIRRRTARVDQLKVVGDGVSHQVTNISDNVEIVEEEATTGFLVNNNNKNYGHYREFGGVFGALILMVLMPAVVIISQLLCTQETCPALPKTIEFPLNGLFDLDASLWYLGYLITQFIFSCIPLGPKIFGAGTKGSELVYRRNGLGCTLLTLSCLAVIRYYLNFQLIEVLDKTLPILITAVFCALLFTILLHILPLDEHNRNPFANSNNTLFDIWIGRYINPNLGPINIKITLIRSSLILIVVYNCLLILNEVETKLNPSDYSISVIVICTLQILLALDPLIFESSLLSSFTVTQEGTGYYLIMALALLPFLITLIPKYIHSFQPEYNVWVTLMIISLHMIGHAIYRVSCLQNDVFQRNPQSLKSSDILFSRHPEKIYRGGLRSRIRYPEYSGLLLIIVSWCTGCLILLPLHWLPVSMLIITTIAIIMHSKRMDNRSNIKHNLNWMTYVSTTSSAIIPYVY